MDCSGETDMTMSCNEGECIGKAMFPSDMCALNSISKSGLEKFDIYFFTFKKVPQRLLQRRKPRPSFLRVQQQLPQRLQRIRQRQQRYPQVIK